jgi:hypothetical protein
MDDAGFDALSRQIVTVPRRIALSGMLAMGAGLRWLAASKSVDAKNKKRKKKRRKKKPIEAPPLPLAVPPPSLSCPPGLEICAGVCCSPERECVAGTCQCKTPCGVICCLDGQICLDEDMNTCGCSAATCPVGCECNISAGGIRVCYLSVAVLCDGLQTCASNFDCPAGTACSLTCDGAVCFPLCDL